MMPASLSGKLEFKTGRPVLGESIGVRMTITNDSDRASTIANPEVGVPPPNLNWSASDEAYQVGVLMSFGIISITLKAADGGLVESRGLMPWVTPVLGKRVLQPHESMTLDFDLNELFSIDLPGVYNVQVRYGEVGAHVDATADIEIVTGQKGLAR